MSTTDVTAKRTFIASLDEYTLLGLTKSGTQAERWMARSELNQRGSVLDGADDLADSGEVFRLLVQVAELDKEIEGLQRSDRLLSTRGIA